MTGPKETPRTSVTREELHRLVWRIPIADLAAQFGILRGHLVAICEELNIPYPRAKFWKRKRNGQPVVAFQLPKKTPGIPDQIVIERTEQTSTEKIGNDRTLDASLLSAAANKTALGVHPIIAAWREDRTQQAALLRTAFATLLRDKLRNGPPGAWAGGTFARRTRRSAN